MPANEYDEFQWPDADGHLILISQTPEWVQRAFAEGDLRISDDLGELRTPEGDHTVNPGDWIIRIRHNGLLAVWSDDLHSAFLQSVEKQPAPVEQPFDNSTNWLTLNAAVEGADAPVDDRHS